MTKEAVTGGRGVSYKIRITNQIRNLVRDSTRKNVRLGLSVAEDITNDFFGQLKVASKNAGYIPKTAVMSPLGTILYGSGANVPEAKKLKLEIYYTKSK